MEDHLKDTKVTGFQIFWVFEWSDFKSPLNDMNIDQTLVNQGPDSTFVDEASSPRSSPKPSSMLSSKTESLTFCPVFRLWLEN